MAASKDYYQVLGVAETATVDEIKKAFRRLAKQYHPDRNPNNAQAAERFKEVNEAHDVLSDPDKRKRYDQLRRYGAYAGAGRGGSAGAPGAGGVDFDLSDLGSFGGLGDLFSTIFGRRGTSGAERLDDEEEIETTVSIPFRVAALGGKVRVTLTMAEVCPTCNGSGAAPGASVSTCPECRGRGVTSFGQGGFAVNRPCPVCRGKGKVPSERCHTCGGSGEVRVEKRLMITVPPGPDDGTKLRLRGQGSKGRPFSWRSSPATRRRSTACRPSPTGLPGSASRECRSQAGTSGSSTSRRQPRARRTATRCGACWPSAGSR